MAIAQLSPASELTIRRPQREDFDRLLKIERRSFRSHRFKQRDFEHHFRSPKSIFAVVEVSGLVVGYVAGIAGHALGPRIAQIHSMAVLPKWRRLGIGFRLLKYFEREATKRGCSSASLEVRKTNRKARALYRQTGYQVERVLKDYYAPGSDGLRMRKALPS